MSKKLKSDFTIGFELEGVLNRSINSRDNLYDELNRMLGGNGDMHYDGSIRYSSLNNETSFEYASPIIDYTPGNVNNIIKCLDKLPSLGVKTNRSCGFHTHISFDGIKKNDTTWFIFWLCATDNYKEFKKLGRTNLYGATYAKFSFLETIADGLRSVTPSIRNIVRNICTNEKYRAIRIHPQGTIEWRGPRTFLNTPKHSKTLTFFQKLDSFISCFIKSMSENEVTVGGVTYTKQQIIDLCASYDRDFVFKTHNKQPFAEKLLESPMILDKMKQKELDKNKDMIMSVIDSCHYGRQFKSKVLLKWFKDNGLDRYISKYFGIDIVLEESDMLYKNSDLFSTLKELSNNMENSAKVYESVKKWHKQGLYANTIALYIKNILTTEYCYAFFTEVIENGMFDLLNESDKHQIVGRYVDNYRYNQHRNYFLLGKEYEMLSAQLKKHNLI